MRKINKAQFEKLITSHRATNPFRKALEKLDVDQALVVGKKEWPYKTTPVLVARSLKGRKFVCRSLSKSFALLRIK